MTNAPLNPAGLTAEEVKRRQEQFGKNELTPQKKESFFKKTLHIISEPMFLLLLVAATIYFLLGEPRRRHFDCGQGQPEADFHRL